MPPDAVRTTCGYCAAVLVVHADRVSTHERASPPGAPDDEARPYAEPEATLFCWQTARFELSTIEQRTPGAVPELLTGVELGEQRFALVSLRVVDKDGAPVRHDLQPAFEALKQSLQQDGDPGLAANLALEALCARPFTHALQCVVVLFDPRHMKVTPYAAGARDGVLWVSSEEGRCVTLDTHHDALERKMLREARDHFENGRAVSLAAYDLVLVASSGFLGRGGKGYGNGLRALLDVANEHLGEEPLRVVTLAKNAFWQDFQKNVSSRPSPTGDVTLVGVRAVLPPVAPGLPQVVTAQTFRSRRFEACVLAGPSDATALLDLHDERKALVWLSPVEGTLPADALAKAQAAVAAVLDRKDHGDNENPRQAGRDAYAALGVGPERVRLAVVQLFDRYGRVKYFRGGWKQPLLLGNRGVKGDGVMAFDEGGEVTVGEGARLFFPGRLDYEGQPNAAEAFAETWTGGKASRLFEALRAHWKTKRSQPALEQLARAALADQPRAGLDGLAVVTGVGG